MHGAAGAAYGPPPPGPRAADERSGPGRGDGTGPAHCPYAGVWRYTVPAVDSTVPRLRHTVRELLLAHRVPAAPETVDGVLLILSELVTNAVRHAAVLSPLVTAEVAVTAGWVRVAVADDHPYRPKALQADHARTGGRGLLLVKAVTAEAGGVCDVEHTAAGGKVVWAALPL
ncbi:MULTISPECIES: ATP-binding protein [Streptomycetaceae]|uniref:Regulatory protein n=1 Tax=Streptantibioticus cattleyicolor (strain ATCC 35852 / DSM 46488 / JCM 4925 / NBRC 14057 / NRRL 8057) TaxID=1003195 RepID=G8X0Q6_STREN|nr:ATP-binding protein [Streptantibioticus cattleyicolor]AEW97295.1 regulatory protein [Streptantibioticus cattleyicolor NRRL 8057 = DSM 46488]